MIPAAEFEGRWERARQNMQREGLEGLLVGDKYNYWYLTGHLSREFDKKSRPMLFLLPRSGTPALVVYAQAEKVLRQTCPTARVYGYEDVPFLPRLLVQAVEESGLAGSRIGM